MKKDLKVRRAIRQFNLEIGEIEKILEEEERKIDETFTEVKRKRGDWRRRLDKTKRIVKWREMHLGVWQKKTKESKLWLGRELKQLNFDKEAQKIAE